MAKRYPREFQEDVVRVARKGDASIVQIAKDFGLAPGTVHDWLKKFDGMNSKTEPESANDSTEVQELKKRNRLLEQENEVLRRAAVYLGKDVLPK